MASQEDLMIKSGEGKIVVNPGMQKLGEAFHLTISEPVEG
jgi:hypothetical protein